MANKDFVSRQWLIDEYHRRHQGPPGGALKMIEEAPAADVAPVGHGRWIPINRSNPSWSQFGIAQHKCSECGSEETIARKRCPECGAKMDKENNNEADSL